MTSRYGKAISAVVYLALVAAYTQLSGDQRIDPDEWVAVAVAAVQAVGVYLIPLAPGARWTKSAVNVLLGVLQVLAVAILGGVDGSEWILIALTAAQLIAGGVLPSRSDNGVSSARRDREATDPEPGVADVY